MRRGSLVAPLLLIALGVAFLLHNVWPYLPVFDTLVKYWPFLLIAWGGVRVIEIGYLFARSRPLPRSGVSGGEWALVTVLFIVGASMWTFRQHRMWFANGGALHGIMMDFGEPFDYPLAPVEKPCAKTPHIVIENFTGNARITGAGEADRIQVAGRKTVRAMQRHDADSADKATPVEIVPGGGDELIVRLNQDKAPDRTRVTDDLDISVPRGASVSCHGRSGDFDVRAIDGSVDVDSDNAGVRLQDIGGNVRADLRRSDIVRAVNVKGSVELRGRGQDVELENISGPVTLEGSYTGQLQFRRLAQALRFDGLRTEVKLAAVPGEVQISPGDVSLKQVKGPIVVSAHSSDVQISQFTDSLDLSLDTGDIDLRPAVSGALPRMDVRSHSGDIELSLPSPGKFDLKAQTDHGEVHDEYGPPLKTSELGNGATIQGLAGAGPSIRLATNRGAITIRKASPEEAAAGPPMQPHSPRPLKPGPPPSPPQTE
jgi:DUF4097 and DUF4098 domain-containing protein YvlB